MGRGADALFEDRETRVGRSGNSFHDGVKREYSCENPTVREKGIAIAGQTYQMVSIWGLSYESSEEEEPELCSQHVSRIIAWLSVG